MVLMGFVFCLMRERRERDSVMAGGVAANRPAVSQLGIRGSVCVGGLLVDAMPRASAIGP
jgi:hypothetical protein